MSDLKTNVLYYGDNLDILRRYVKDETVDLIYLDPPFNSNAAYNVLFGELGQQTLLPIGEQDGLNVTQIYATFSMLSPLGRF